MISSRTGDRHSCFQLFLCGSSRCCVICVYVNEVADYHCAFSRAVAEAVQQCNSSTRSESSIIHKKLAAIQNKHTQMNIHRLM